MANIRKRGNSYQIRVSAGYRADGTQISRSKTWTPEPGMTERQIEKELNRQAVIFEEECRNGHIGGAIRFEVFAEQWFEEYAKKNLRNTTYSFMRHLRERVYKAIGHLSMDKITVRQLQVFINSLSEEGANEANGKALSPKSVRHILSFISDIFSYAVRMEVVSDNPCHRVILPKIQKAEKKIYTPEEVRTLMGYLEHEDIRYRACFMLMIFTGCRRGEIMGLEWKDFDFESCIVNIRRTSCYTPSRGIYTDTTKTEQSKRVLKIPREVADVLIELREWQNRRAELLGDKWTDCDRLFTKEHGEPQQPNMPYKWLERFCREHDIPFYGLHAFRHLFASLLVSNGVDIVTVSGMLGHSSVSTTGNIYCHVIEETRVRAADTVSAALGFGAGDNGQTMDTADICVKK